MDAQELRNLQEAYMDVYQELDEDRVPVRSRGGRSAPEGERSIGGEANRRNKDYWASVEGIDRDRGEGHRAKKRKEALKKEQIDLYDIILSHLLDEGYAETPEAAEVIMVNMSEDWMQSIVEELEQLDEISDALVGRLLNARIAKTAETGERAHMHRNPEAMRAAERAAEKEARTRRLIARRRERIQRKSNKMG